MEQNKNSIKFKILRFYLVENIVLYPSRDIRKTKTIVPIQKS